MNWLQLLLAAFSLGKELIKYLQSKEESKRICGKELQQVAKDLKEGRINGNTSKIEQAFRNLNLRPISDKVQDSTGESKPT